MSLFYGMLLIITKLCSSHKFQINFIVIFCNRIICRSQVHTQPLESVDLQHAVNIERPVFIRGRNFVVMDIVTLI